MLESLRGTTSAIVGVALDGLALQQRLSANNIANAGSVGYSARRVDFESALRDAARIGSNDDASAIKARVAQVGDALAAGSYLQREGDATVQFDMELARLNETVLKYQALLHGLDISGSFMRMAVSGEGA